MNRATLLSGTGRTRTRFGHRAHFAEGLYRVGNDVFAWMVPNGSWGETNLGLVRLGKSSVLIDTCWSLPHMREVLESVAPIVERAPIEVVINTHADGDHCWGNQLFADREIVASNACIGQMHHLRPQSLQVLAMASSWVKRLPSSGLSRFGRYMNEMLHPYDFSGISISAATRGFSDRHVMMVGGEAIVLTEVGPGHTNGDVIVEIPSRRVAFCGDVLFIGVTPVMWAGPIEGLLRGLQVVRGLDADVLVPGHGPLASTADVQALIDYWHYVQEQLHPLFQSGVPAAKAALHVLLSADFAMRPWAGWGLPERLVTNAITLYRQWGVAPDRFTLPGAAGVMWQQAGVASALESRFR